MKGKNPAAAALIETKDANAHEQRAQERAQERAQDLAKCQAEVNAALTRYGAVMRAVRIVRLEADGTERTSMQIEITIPA